MIEMSVASAATAIGAQSFGSATFRGVGTDSRTLPEGALFVALRGEQFDGHDHIPDALARGVAVVMTQKRPAEDVPALLVDDTRAAMLELSRHWRNQFELPVAAVTGSNGKTTVKEMLAAIFNCQPPSLATAGNFNNDIGVPLTLFGLGAEHRSAVFELGANHVGEIAMLTKLVRPKVGVITQCAPAHLEGFGTVEDVARAKGELFEHLDPDGTAIINAEDAFAPLWREIKGARDSLSFGLSQTADVSATWSLQADVTRVVLLTPNGVTEVRLRLPGRHSVMNALAATAAALAMGYDLEDVAHGLSKVEPIKGRLRPLLTSQEVRVLDDTYNANPTSLRAGLEVLSQYDGVTWLVMGDMAELGDAESRFHEEAGVLAREYGVQRLFATGSRARYAVDAFGEGAEHFDDQAELIDALCASTDAGVTLLIKGSRSMKMERVVAALTEVC